MMLADHTDALQTIDDRFTEYNMSLLTNHPLTVDPLLKAIPLFRHHAVFNAKCRAPWSTFSVQVSISSTKVGEESAFQSNSLNRSDIFLLRLLLLLLSKHN